MKSARCSQVLYTWNALAAGLISSDLWRSTAWISLKVVHRERWSIWQSTDQYSSVTLLHHWSSLLQLFHTTLCLQKTIHLTFDHNLGKCRLIFKILSLRASQRNSVCNCYRVFNLTLIVLLHYLAEFKSLT